MALKSLFDERRRREIREGIRRGKLELGNKGRRMPETEGPQPAKPKASRPAKGGLQQVLEEAERRLSEPDAPSQRRAAKADAPEPEADNAITSIQQQEADAPWTEADLHDDDSETHSGGVLAGPSSIIAIGRGMGICEVDQYLFDAIKEGSVKKVLAAIGRGADVNQAHLHSPSYREGHAIILEQMTPLEYAKRQGSPQIISLLKRHGAKE